MSILLNRKRKKQVMEESMLNLVKFVGKIVELQTIQKTPDGIKYATIVLEIPRMLPMCGSDRVVVKVWRNISDCKVGNHVSICGHVQTYQVEMKNEIYYNYEFIADCVSFFNR